MTAQLDEQRLDDEDLLEAADPGGMLRQVASSAAQVRSAWQVASDVDLDSVLAAGRPRAVVVTGMGGSGVAGDVLAAVCGAGCPVPIVTVHDYQLPGWVSTADLVIAVSCSGSTEETLEVAREAVRRGCRLAAVGGAGSPLAAVATQARAPFVPVTSAGQPRSTLWGLSIPLVVIAERLGLTQAGTEAYESAAARLEEMSHRCRPGSETFVNPAKSLAAELAGTVPMIWGTSPLTGVAAYRFCCQLNENAKHPGVYGVLPEADHNQVVTFDGPFAGPARGYGGFGAGGGYPDDGADGADGPDGAARPLRLVILRDTREHPQVTRRREVSAELASGRGVGISEVAAEGDHPLDRLASVVQLIDYATVYLALGTGIDPSPVAAIEELKGRIAQPG
jgi:glucose/mannose-6-phosphate isomerase